MLVPESSSCADGSDIGSALGAELVELEIYFFGRR